MLCRNKVWKLLSFTKGMHEYERLMRTNGR